MKKYLLATPWLYFATFETLAKCLQEMDQHRETIEIKPEDKHVLYAYHSDKSFTLCEYHFPDDESFFAQVEGGIKAGYQIYAWHRL